MEASDFIPDDRREWRRLRALHLKQQGWYQRDIAAALSVSEGLALVVATIAASITLGVPGER